MNVALRNTLIKAIVAVVALAALGALFVRSARNVGAEPYEIERERLAGWTLAIDPPASGSGALLVSRPNRELAPALFALVFSRTQESLREPSPRPCRSSSEPNSIAPCRAVSRPTCCWRRHARPASSRRRRRSAAWPNDG